MKSIVSLALFCAIILFSCTDRDDNLEGVQIRVQNDTETTFVEVDFDSVLFADVKPKEIAFYKKFNDSTLPSNIKVSSDSLTLSMAIGNLFVADSVEAGLYTYRIKEFSNETGIDLELLKD